MQGKKHGDGDGIGFIHIVADSLVFALRRAIVLNEVVNQTRPLVVSEVCINQMLPDWKKLDFETVNEFVSWTCQWQYEFLRAGRLTM